MQNLNNANNENFIPNLLNFFNMIVNQMPLNNNQLDQNGVDAFQAILLHWKRPFKASDVEFNPSCSVCLDSFNIDEEIIELHCNPEQGHIFHPECIQGWAEKQHTCPLCRKDFIELVKDERNRGLIPEEVKADRANGNVRVIRDYRQQEIPMMNAIHEFNRILINQPRANLEMISEESSESQLQPAPVRPPVVPNIPRQRVVLPPIQRNNSFGPRSNDYIRMRMNQSF
uniref:RING-type domain-containing protein n=1 Tax=Euplotes harpa TaxID=151035 RepID=A0A7S3N4H7_9SPIT|mmetsp:Transcript_10222/g.11478  ORF Transcript_10222/g.11478 Transcript_10222/m.11478 type:complete len:228 (+) Transcript_10222:702-1385(+)|eukprot:CAMPEP_0168353798 /NCGR_PEP_ID=MMETSP0213-20121227/23474_1 /TAXON_ID=151035 /ORGANISM="Euplotes harpa, Strain FSP1.4" /LENGTH=227 /DNA_ID=CAMNT_0008365495 /DNA_START=524 /DNA_END=1207 /DNA_ORIENTATION=+